MSSFTNWDFYESINRAEGFVWDDIATAEAAWGENGDYNEWSGGFLMKLKDGRFAYVSGWCDTTGWGCQDGAETTIFDEKPELAGLEDRPRDWDLEPVDLNRLLRGEITKFD